MGRDLIEQPLSSNVYSFVGNGTILHVDILGNKEHNENHKGVSFAIENGDKEDNIDINTAVWRGNKWHFSPNTGEDMLKYLSMVTKEKENNCIHLLTIAGHGHGTYDDRNGIPGNPMHLTKGLYLDEISEYDRQQGARSLKDLSELISNKNIVFCKKCYIELYACRKGKIFASELSVITGCDVIFASGSCGLNKIEGESGWISGPEDEVEYATKEYMGFYIAKPDGSIEKYGSEGTIIRPQSSKYKPRE